MNAKTLESYIGSRKTFDICSKVNRNLCTTTYVVKHGQGHDINEVLYDNSFNTIYI